MRTKSSHQVCVKHLTERACCLRLNLAASNADWLQDNSNQDVLETCYNTNITDRQYHKYIAHVEKYGKELGVDKIMDEYNLNIIIGPLECDLGNFAASAGKPVLPSLSTLFFFCSLLLPFFAHFVFLFILHFL